MTIGPYSKDRQIINACVDKRTKVGRVYRATVQDLTNQIGNPTPAQILLIQSAALKSCRLYLLSERFLNEDEIANNICDNQALAWLNSLRMDLQAIGLEKKAPKEIGPTLSDILRAHRDAEDSLQ